MLVVVFNFVLAILLVVDDLDGINCLPKMAHKFLSPGGIPLLTVPQPLDFLFLIVLSHIAVRVSVSQALII